MEELVENSSGEELLPFEFARTNRIVLGEGKIFVAPDTVANALIETRRFLDQSEGGQAEVVGKTSDEFDELLRITYANRRDSSAAVMEDIQDFVDLESAAEALEKNADAKIRITIKAEIVHKLSLITVGLLQ